MTDCPMREPAAELTAEELTQLSHDLLLAKCGTMPMTVEAIPGKLYALVIMARRSLTQAARIAELEREREGWRVTGYRELSVPDGDPLDPGFNHVRVPWTENELRQRAETAEAALQVAQHEIAMLAEDRAVLLRELGAQIDATAAAQADLTRLKAIETAAQKLVRALGPMDESTYVLLTKFSGFNALKSALAAPPTSGTTEQTE